MPIEIKAKLRRPSADEFSALAYDVMACAFSVHNEIGRLFDENVYKRLVAKRFGGIELEVPVIVSYRDFEKTAVHWVNVSRRSVQIRTLKRSDSGFLAPVT